MDVLLGLLPSPEGIAVTAPCTIHSVPGTPSKAGSSLQAQELANTPACSAGSFAALLSHTATGSNICCSGETEMRSSSYSLIGERQKSGRREQTMCNSV